MPKQKVSPIVSGWHPPMSLENPAIFQPGWHAPLNPQYIDLLRLTEKQKPLVPPQPVVNGTPTEAQVTQIDASNTPETVLGVPDRSPAITSLDALRKMYAENVASGRMQPNIPGTTPEQKITSSYDQKQSSGGKQYTNYDLEELKRLYNNVLEANPVARDYKTLLDAQRAGLLKRLEAPTPVNLSGAMNVVDTLTGSKMGEGYRPPVDLTPAQFEEYQKNLQEFSKTQSDEVKAQKSGEINQALMGHILTKEEYERLNPTNHTSGQNQNRSDTNLKAVYDDFTKANKDILDAQNASGKILNIIKRKDWLSDQNINALLTEAANLKPVSDLDRQIYEGSKNFWDQGRRLFNRFLSMKGYSYTDRERAVLLDYMTKYFKLANNARLRKVKEAADAANKAFYNPPKDASAYLNSMTSPAYNPPAEQDTPQGKMEPESPKKSGSAAADKIKAARDRLNAIGGKK